MKGLIEWVYNLNYDVIVVGTGPGGSIAAWKCAEVGLKTILIDKKRLPRDKLCGGGVRPWIFEHFNIPNELMERKAEFDSVYQAPKFNEIRIQKDFCLVSREKFDHYLAKQAEQCGAIILEETKVQSVLTSSDNKVNGIKTNKGNFEAPIVIAADGASSRIAQTAGLWKQWGMNSVKDWFQNQVLAIETIYSLDEKKIDEVIGNRICMVIDSAITGPAYGWVFPKKDTIYTGVGVWAEDVGENETIASYARRQIANFAQIEFVHEIIKEAVPIETKGAYIPWAKPHNPIYSDGLMVVGDAASHVSSMSGEGIPYAARGGEFAAKTAILAHEAGDFSGKKLSLYQEMCDFVFGSFLNKSYEMFQKILKKKNRNRAILNGLVTLSSLEDNRWVENPLPLIEEAKKQ